MRYAGTLMVAALMLIPASANAQDRNLEVRLKGLSQPVRLDTLVVWTVVPARYGETFTAVKQVFETSKLSVTRADSVNGLLFAEPVDTTREIMGRKMSWALDCGQRNTVPNADHYQIARTFAVFLEPTVDQQTRLGIALAATANPTGTPVRRGWACGSTGAFERELGLQVKARVQVKAPASRPPSGAASTDAP